MMEQETPLREKDWRMADHWGDMKAETKKPKPWRLSDQKFQTHLLDQFGAEKVAGFSEALIKTLRDFFDTATTLGADHAAGYSDTLDQAYDAGKEDAWEDHDWRIDKIFQSQIYDDAYDKGYREALIHERAKIEKAVSKKHIERVKVAQDVAYRDGFSQGVAMGMAQGSGKLHWEEDFR